MIHVERLEPRLVLSAGTLDPTFGQFGRATHTLPTDDDDYADQVAVLNDGRILLGGGDVVGSHLRATVQRLTADGNPDPTFGDRGIVTLPRGVARAMAVQPDGKIVVLVDEGGADTAVYRLNPDGSPDASFGDRGRTLAIERVNGYSFVDPTAVAVLPDGRILIGGNYVEEYDAEADYFPTEMAFVR